MSIDTQRFQAMLLAERERVQRAIASLREDHPGRMDEEGEEIAPTHDSHLAQTATVTLDREIDYTLGENSARLLTAIDGALERIESGTYGTCAGCGGAIAEGRLDAEPWASLCIDCQRRAERG